MIYLLTYDGYMKEEKISYPLGNFPAYPRYSSL